LRQYQKRLTGKIFSLAGISIAIGIIVVSANRSNIKRFARGQDQGEGVGVCPEPARRHSIRQLDERRQNRD
jgi:hypothetical protein